MPDVKSYTSTLNYVVVLSNTIAGKGKAGKVVSIITKRLELAGIRYRLHVNDWPLSLAEFSSVFVVGGDGTLNYFINRYPDLNIPIAIFKGGSGNDFAWQLYGNKSVAEYIGIIFQERITKVDAGRCNDRLFLNGFGIGFDGAIVESMGMKKRFSAGHIAYLYTVLKKVLFFKEPEVQFCIEGQTVRTEQPFLIAVANGSRYGGGFLIAPGAVITDGKLDFVLIRKLAPLRRIFKIGIVQKGRHLSMPFVEHGRLKQILVESSDRTPAHCDGELIRSDRFSIEILPAHFKFYV